MRRLGEDVIRRHLDELGEGPVVRNTENTVLLARYPRVLSPVQRRVNNHLGPLVRTIRALSAGDDLAGPIGTWNHRKNLRRDARILPPRSKQIPTVERRRAQPNNGLPRTRLQLAHVLIDELVRTFEFVQSNGFHVAPFGRSGIRLQVSGYRYQLNGFAADMRGDLLGGTIPLGERERR